MTTDCAHSNLEIKKRLEAIYNLNPAKTIFRLDKGPYIDLLEKLGNPHLNLAPVIHVAGTNGKGSTIAFLKSLFEANGKTVHIYTSPHLLKFNERITLAGNHINDDMLLKYLDLIETTNNNASLTFFEYTTALAFKVFADHPADVLLLETGLGGRLDCTNVVRNPAATIITAIGYDHMDWLGHDIKTIAKEKAGIMKPNSQCFIAPQKYDLNGVFKQKALDIGCDIHFVEQYDELPQLGLIGNHQKDNSSVAFSVFNTLTNNNDKSALKNTQWPARMEKISNTPEIWFDCGHNVDGANTIAEQLKQWKFEKPNRPIHLVVGLASDKDAQAYINPMVEYLDSVTCIDLLNARNPQNGADLSEKINISIPKYTAKAYPDALSTIPDDGGIIMITGSLYLYEQIKDQI